MKEVCRFTATRVANHGMNQALLPMWPEKSILARIGAKIACTWAGLDARALLDATQDPEVKAELIANTEAAAARGAFGIPTFFVGDEIFFGKERLGQVEEQLAA